MGTSLTQTGRANLTRAAAIARAPGATDDAGKDFSVGSTWLDTSAVPSVLYICTDNTVGAAKWRILPPNCLGYILSADMNSTADQEFAMNVFNQRISIDQIIATNASISLTTAVGGVYPAASKGGTALVANTQVYTALTGGAGTKVALTLAGGVATTAYVADNIFLSLTTPQGAAATADLYIFGKILSRN